MASSHPTAEEILQLLEQALELERQRFIALLRSRPDLTPAFEIVPAEWYGQMVRQQGRLLRQRVALGSELYRRTPKPRNTERNAAIVRLHDEEKLSFGQIGRALAKRNSAWVGRDGKPLTYAAVEKAYRDEKKREKSGQ